jgi:hypothetical protein
MASLRLNINEKVLDKVLWLLGHFSKEEVEIIYEDAEFIGNRKTVQDQLKKIEEGKAQFLTIEELEAQVQETISKYGD